MDQKSNVFITGASGLLGSYILRYLELSNQYNITALKRKDSLLDLIPIDIRDDINWIEGDIKDYDFIDKIIEKNDYVIHSAAEVHFSQSHQKQLFGTNISATEEIANACLRHKIKKLVYISSTAALGRSYNNQKIDEKTMWETSKINTQYAISKHFGEREVWRAHEEGLNIGILNPSLIISPGFFNKSSAGIYNRLYNELKYYPTGTNAVVDVRDVAKLCLQLMESESTKSKIIACAENISYKSLFQSIANYLGKPTPSKPIQSHHRFILQNWYKLKNIFGIKGDINKAALINTSMNFYYDNNLSKTYFDFKYRDLQTSLKDASLAYIEAKAKNKDFCILPL